MFISDNRKPSFDVYIKFVVANTYLNRFNAANTCLYKILLASLPHK